MMATRCEVCGGLGEYHRRYWWMRTRWFHVLRALKFAFSIARKPWQAETDEPFENISWTTAWEVSRGIHLVHD